jgi:hypothetical protein
MILLFKFLQFIGGVPSILTNLRPGASHQMLPAFLSTTDGSSFSRHSYGSFFRLHRENAKDRDIILFYYSEITAEK